MALPFPIFTGFPVLTVIVDPTANRRFYQRAFEGIGEEIPLAKEYVFTAAVGGIDRNHFSVGELFKRRLCSAERSLTRHSTDLVEAKRSDRDEHRMTWFSSVMVTKDAYSLSFKPRASLFPAYLPMPRSLVRMNSMRCVSSADGARSASMRSSALPMVSPSRNSILKACLSVP